MSTNALRAAQALQQRLAADRFVWPSESHYLDKVREELDEIALAIDPNDIFDEVGDLLLSCSAAASALNVDASEALLAALARFDLRYREWLRGSGDSETTPSSPDGRARWARCKEVARANTPRPPIRSAVAVIGAWDEQAEEILAVSKEIGRALARTGSILVTGGGPGVMAAATEAAHLAGGLTVGFLGTDDPHAEGTYQETGVIIPTALGWDVRSSLMLRMVKAIVVVGGAVGTLQEVTMAYVNKTPIIVFRCGSEMEVRLEEFCIDGKWIDRRKNIPLTFVTNIDEMETALRELS